MALKNILKADKRPGSLREGATVYLRRKRTFEGLSGLREQLLPKLTDGDHSRMSHVTERMDQSA